MIKFLRENPVIPILNTGNVNFAIAVASELEMAGCKSLEVVLRQENALNVLQQLVERFPNLKVGAGTVTSKDKLKQAYDTGADFFVSPGYSAQVIQLAQDLKINILPGASSPGEIMQLNEYGFSTIKIFPINFLGSASYLKQLCELFPDLFFCATGGICEKNISEYSSLQKEISVASSWVCQTASSDDKAAINTGKRYKQLLQSFVD